MDAAMLTSIAALVTAVTALVGIMFTYIKLRDERSQWQKAIQGQHDQWRKEHDADLKSKFLIELVEERYRTYPAVLSILGSVRDIPDPHEEHWKSLETDREQLLAISNTLIKHLYGEAGLVMSMQTRNKLLSVYYACQLFYEHKISLPRLVQEFFEARRQLRQDLQLEDLGERSELSEIRESFRQ